LNFKKKIICKRIKEKEIILSKQVNLKEFQFKAKSNKRLK